LFGFFIYFLGLDEADKFILRKMFFKIRQIRIKGFKNEK